MFDTRGVLYLFPEIRLCKLEKRYFQLESGSTNVRNGISGEKVASQTWEMEFLGRKLAPQICKMEFPAKKWLYKLAK